MNGSQTYRFAVCKHFAKLAHERNLRWAVLHGAEDYPNNIGRDIDCLCATTEDARTALACFHEAAAAHPATKWITYPHPIWGHRCIAISSDYQAAELHILHDLSSGLIAHRVDFNRVDMSKDFPQEYAAFLLKAIVMPLLGNSPKVLKTIAGLGEHKLPECVLHAYDNLKNHGKISLSDRVHLYLYFNKNPLWALRGMRRFCYNKVYSYLARTVPVFYFDEWFSEADIEALGKRLSEIFLGTQNVSLLSRASFRPLQSLQLFLYDRRPGHTPDAVPVPHLRGDEAADFIISTFSSQHSHPRI